MTLWDQFIILYGLILLYRNITNLQEDNGDKASSFNNLRYVLKLKTSFYILSSPKLI